VTVEPACELWSISRPEFVESLVWKTLSGGDFEWKYKRKRYMVNAVHTAIALLGYARVRKLGLGGDVGGRQAFPLVVDAVLGNRENRRLLDVFRRAQALRLMLESQSSINSESGGLRSQDGFDELVETAQRATERFRQFPDELTRVLSDTDEQRLSRFLELIQPLDNYVVGKDYIQAANLASVLAAERARDRWHDTLLVRGRPPIPEVRAVIAHLRSLA